MEIIALNKEMINAGTIVDLRDLIIGMITEDLDQKIEDLIQIVLKVEVMVKIREEIGLRDNP
jgi:hypothetical protein